MRTQIPARTEIRCDRCTEIIPHDVDAEQLVLNPRYEGDEYDAQYDLCRDCLDSFQVLFLTNHQFAEES